MANNRMYLRCKCRQDNGVFLGKCFAKGYYTDNYQNTNTLIDRLNEYYDKHDKCFNGNKKGKYKWKIENQYYVAYEWDKDWGCANNEEIAELIKQKRTYESKDI